MMGASPRSRGLASSGGASISIRPPRPPSFTPSRRTPLLRISPRVLVLALFAAACGLYTLVSRGSNNDGDASSLLDRGSATFSHWQHSNDDSQRDAGGVLPEMVHRDTPLEQVHAAREQHPLPKLQVERPSQDQQQRQEQDQIPKQAEEEEDKEELVTKPLAVINEVPADKNTDLEEQLASIKENKNKNNNKKQNPFDTYLCTGDEWQLDEDSVYSKPFRFHVYQNMPDHLVKDVVERAAHWWQPDNASNQFITEVQIYKYLSLHPCHTDDPLEADAFIVPAQTVSAIWLAREKGPNGEAPLKDEGASYMKEVMQWIKKQRTGRRFDGRDHYVVSVPWWMGGRPYGGHVNLIGVEVPISFGTHQNFADTLYLRASNDIIVPYPDPDSYAYYTDEMLDNVEKDLHMVFVGQNRVVAPIRQKVWDQLKAYNERRGDRPKALWHHLKNRDAIQDVKKKTARAIFGPVMKGDSYSSRRLFSLLFAGTIPVIICDFCMLPYQDMLDYSKFVVFLPESEVLDNPDYDIFDVLDAIPQSELDRLRHNGRIVKKHFVFHEGKPLPGDAFDMMVREMAFTHLRNRGLKAMMLRGYGEDDEQQFPLMEELPVPGQELAFVGPGVPEAALQIREEREKNQPSEVDVVEEGQGPAAAVA